MKAQRMALATITALVMLTGAMEAQWVARKTPGIPRLPNGVIYHGAGLERERRILHGLNHAGHTFGDLRLQPFNVSVSSVQLLHQ